MASVTLKQVTKMGGLGSLMGMMPGMGQMKDKLKDAGIEDSLIKRQLAIIQSMTKKERVHPKLLNASRKRRIAEGSGTSVPEVNRMVKQHQEMQNLMKRMKKLGKKGLMRQGIKGLFKK